MSLSSQEVLHCANRSYEKLLHSSLDDDLLTGSGAGGSRVTSHTTELTALGGKSSPLAAGGGSATAGTSGSAATISSTSLQFANDVLASCRCSCGVGGTKSCSTASCSLAAPRSSAAKSPAGLRSSTPTTVTGTKATGATHGLTFGGSVSPSISPERYSSSSRLHSTVATSCAASGRRYRSSSPTAAHSTSLAKLKVDGSAAAASSSSASSLSPRASASLALSPALPTAGGVQAAVDSLKLSPIATGGGSSSGGKSAAGSPIGDYSYISTDNIRELQSIRHSLRHVLHGDMAGVEELLTSRLAHIKRQEAANVESAVRSSADVTHLINTSLHSENQLLRDTLDRERYRRKQFEKQTETLQGRLGEEQEQFSSALAALKKKDTMIDQLDKTLAKVVEGWQSHEGETQRYVEQLEKTQRQLASELSEQREAVASLEVDLSNAVDDLAREQERASLAAFDKNNKIQLLEEELRRLTDSLEEERSRSHRLELDRSATAEARDRVEQTLQTLQMTLSEERSAFQEREQELVTKIDEISGIQITVLENEQKKAAEQERHLLSSEAKLALALRDVQSLTARLEEAELDKERAAADIATLKAKHEAQLKQQEADLRLQTADVVLRLRQEWAERLSEREAELSGVHRQQVTELHERHARQTGELTARHHSELAELRARYQLQLAELGRKIDELEEEVHSLRYTKRKMEAQSKEMTTRLQSMMTMHASEALKILTNTTPSPPATSSALALKAEVTTVLSHHGLQKRQGPAAASSSVSVPALPPYEDPTPAIKVTAAVGEEQSLLQPGGPRSGDVRADGGLGATAVLEEAVPAGGAPSGGSVSAASADAVSAAAREEQSDANAVAPGAPFANGDKERTDYENGEDYNEDGGESYESNDTYGVTPRSDDQYGNHQDEAALDSQRQHALQSYIQKLLTQSPAQLGGRAATFDADLHAALSLALTAAAPPVPVVATPVAAVAAAPTTPVAQRRSRRRWTNDRRGDAEPVKLLKKGPEMARLASFNVKGDELSAGHFPGAAGAESGITENPLKAELADLVERYGADVAPNLEDFLSYLRQTQTSAKDRTILSGGDSSPSARDVSRKKTRGAATDNGQLSPRGRKNGQTVKPNAAPWR